jgi:bifunctional DNA-binding transcriptional regulator/antitoxin component of YhaV-PrlF toxin-antitoxin module
MESLTMGERGEITLPDGVRQRYGLGPETSVRIIETSGGILLVPLTDEPMNEDLITELQEWQSLSAESWEQAFDEITERIEIPEDSDAL